MSDGNMKVMLAVMWFGPDGVRYRPDPAGTLIPAQFKDKLPSTAVIVVENIPVEAPMPKPKREKPPRMTQGAPKQARTLSQVGKEDLKADTLSELSKVMGPGPVTSGSTQKDLKDG